MVYFTGSVEEHFWRCSLADGKVFELGFDD